MTPVRSLRVSVLVVAGTGIAALSLSLASAAWLLLAMGLFAAYLVLAALRPAWHLRRGLATVAAVAAAWGFVAEVAGTGAFLVPAAHFLLISQLVFLSQERTNRNYGLICVVSLVHIMLAGVLSVDLFFGLCFLVYLPAGVAALVLLNLSAELERHGSPAGAAPRVRPRLLGAIALVAAVEFVLTVAVFLYFPRFGIQLFQFRPVQRGPTLTGFSDRIQFGDLGRILSNAQAVMAVRLLHDGQPIQAATFPLRWRATAHDTYENAAWSTKDYIKESDSRPFDREGECRLPPRYYRFPGIEVTQEVTLEPISTRMLFYLPQLLMLKTATPNLDSVFWHAESRTASSPRGSSVSLRYIAASRVPSWSAEQLRQPRSRLPGYPEVSRALQLPRSITPRMRALAEQIVAGIPPDAFYDRARAVEAHLKGRYEYSLNPSPPRAGVDPVEDFLFEHRSGHCEYFASAMAILLRTLGIPARVATGFCGGEWNDFGQFYTVRQRNAHAWVEAYIPAVRDWETFDPTPLGEALLPAPTGWLADLDSRLAHLRLLWNSYVVNYSTQEQHDLRDAALRLLSRLSNAIPSWGSGLFALEGGRAGGALGVVGIGLLLLLGAGAALLARRLVRVRRRRRAGAGVAGRPTVGFYRRMEAILRRRGFRRGAAVTPKEFAAAVIAEGGATFAPAAIVAEAFGRVRYGARTLTPAEQSGVAAALTRLADAPL
ncbi:MAG TPA: DUF3488 and transglutaminase-like domain-containing protein [Planctomycetota bacterium]|nr:DUF3488 and transglutaminase-like domain-containing protein [Planctomycetota bacterium]